ncbi:MAG: glycosyltransferase [Steroidobacteraceae bacterium]
MKVAIVTDAWRPQTNGVVQTLSTTAQTLRASGHDVLLVEPNRFRTFPCPTYPEIRLAWFPYRRVANLLSDFAPDCIHIATEATLGTAARSWCVRNSFAFTTPYHTQFPDYVRARAPIPLAVSYAHLRRFHSAAARTMVATPTLQEQLEIRGFRNIVRWTRGVDVAAYPVTGPIDVIENGTTGMLDEDLRAAALAALKLDPAKCRSFALQHTWAAATRQFIGNLVPRGERVGLKPALQPDPQRSL